MEQIEWDEIAPLMRMFDRERGVKYEIRRNHQLKGCPSHRYRVEGIDTETKTIRHVCRGYYYTCGNNASNGSLYTASYAYFSGCTFRFDYAKIYQYVNRHEIDGIPKEQLYHGSSVNYVDGIYFKLIAEGTVNDFRKEYKEFLKCGTKKFPLLI